MTKHITVIGGSSGLGKVISEIFAEKNEHVSIISRNRPAYITEYNTIKHYPGDLSSLTEEAAAEISERISIDNGPIDNIIFCQRYRGADRTIAPEMQVSVTATALMIDAMQRYMTSGPGSAIVAVSSVYADYIGSTQPLAYHVAKAGLNALVRYYANKLGTLGIRVNAIAPLTYLKDESRHYYMSNEKNTVKYQKLVPLRRMPDAMECAKVVSYLCSSDASFVNGQIMYVDGGVSTIWPEELV